MLKEKNSTVISKQENQSYWNIVRAQFRKNKTAVWSLRFIIVIFIIGMSANFIANEKPYYCKINDKVYFPIFKELGVNIGIAKWDKELSNVNWKELPYQEAIWPPVPYLPQNTDYANADYKSPFEEQNVKSSKWRHHLGTDQLGRDVLSGMIHGTQVAMLVGVISMSISLLIGLIIGAIAGFYGDNKLKVSRGSILLYFIFFFIAWFYAFSIRGYVIADAMSESILGLLIQLCISFLIFLAVMAIPYFISKLLNKFSFFGQEINLPIDLLISRFIEIFQSIPTTLLILSIVAILKKPSIYWVMVIIGFTSWTGIARYIRAELLKVRSLEYIEAANALGYNEWRILFKHALPNSLTSVLIAVAFGVAAAILTESGLSFLGIGLGAEEVTWGSMLSTARGDVSAWWMAIFPGVAIFITVTLFNLLGEGLTDAMDPRLKQ